MKSEIKTAIIMGIIVVGAIAGLGIYFNSLEESKVIQIQNTQNIDKSRLTQAPKLEGISGFINTDADTLENQIKDKVVLYDIWTYSCINCQRTLPYITAWNEKYSDEGLLIIGIHSPEFEFEKDIKNVELATEKFGIKYPVVLDNDKKIWDAFENRYWPRKYIADSEGYIRYDHIGEGSYDETEKVIQQLLSERAERLGLTSPNTESLVNIEENKPDSKTPEIYFGYDFALGRNQLGNSEGFQAETNVTYSIPDKLHEDNFYLQGTWKNLSDRMVLTSKSGKIILPYFAKQVNIVASGKSELTIFLDGKLITETDAGNDVKNSRLATSEPTLYNIVKTKDSASHVIEIQVDSPGLEVYTFTFG